MTKSNSSSPSRSYLLLENEIIERENQRLRKQAEAVFLQETEALRRLGFRTPRRILELGCGNGRYLSQWSELLGQVVLGGVDRNSRLLELAKENIPDAQWFHEDLLDSVALERVFAAFAPDTVILRFVMQHLNPSECRRILDALFRLRSMHSFQLILEDPDDSKIEHYPFSQALESAIRGVMAKQAANGGDRTRGSQLLALCREAGFLKVSFEVVDFGSLSIGWEGVREILLPLWRQGCASEKELEGVMEWLAAATSIETNAKLRSPVFIVHA